MKINDSCLFFTLLVLLLSYTLAVDISKQDTTTEKAKDADANKVEAKGDGGKYGVNYGGGGGNYGGGGGNYGGGGGNYGGGGGGWGGGCRHGCCYRGRGGSCNKCCSSPEEAKALMGNQAEVKKAADEHKDQGKGDEAGKYGVNYGGGGGGNYGGGGGNYGGGGGGSYGGGCRHGCCYRGYRGSCNRCCASPEEAKALEKNQEAGKEIKGDKRKEDAEAHKVEAKGDAGKYGVNYGGGGGGGNYGGGGGGSWGGGCRHGCCYKGHGGSCNKCCSSPEEAKAMLKNQSHP